MGSGLNIEIIKKNDLKKIIETNSLWNSGGIIPFSKAKANWLLQNDRLEEDDCCAILGFDNDVLVSFIYFVPDFLNLKYNKQKVFWCRRWWIADDYKDSVLSTYSMNMALESVSNNVIIKFLGREVINYYKKQPFAEFSNRTRYFILFNLDTNSIVKKAKFLKYFKPVLRRIDKSSLKFCKNRILKKIQDSIKEIDYEYMASLDNDTWNFVKDRCSDDLILKTKEYINWQVSNAQYNMVPIQEKHKFNCLVASELSHIYNINLKILKEGEVVGFISYLIRNNEFNIRYFLYKKNNFDKVVDALMHNFIVSRANVIYTENEILGKYISTNFRKVYVDNRKLYSLVHTDLNFDFSNQEVFDQDGNFA